jgi:iron complex outermembrane receptor protein
VKSPIGSTLPGGLNRARIGSFDFDSALLYSEAAATDSSLGRDRHDRRCSKSLALSTPDAYNPFNGGCIDRRRASATAPLVAGGDRRDHFQLKRRQSKTTLTPGRFPLSRARSAPLPGGDLGIAFGVEVRRETQRDDSRFQRSTASSPFIDAVTGETNRSATPPRSARRRAPWQAHRYRAYAELAVPVSART